MQHMTGNLACLVAGRWLTALTLILLAAFGQHWVHR
jgi:hypothetical protein